MIVNKSSIFTASDPDFRYLSQFSDAAFFDIETTGLYWKQSHLYMIGAIVQIEPGRWELTQWFAQKPAEEKNILQAFCDLISDRRTIVHFNGSSFDIPYLQHKLFFYEMDNPLFHVNSMDLYRHLMPLKKLYSLDSFRQKDAEKLTDYIREDSYSGKELIGVYGKYLKYGDTAFLDVLLRHNLDDLIGMLHLTGLLELSKIEMIHPDLQTASRSGQNDLILTFTLPLSFSKTIIRCIDGISLTAKKNTGCLTIPLFHGTLKHFYPDYKNYYYLPLEDEAIHKSVALYVDAAHRQKATASNCYKKITGEFLPIFYPADVPLFCGPDSTKNDFIRWEDTLLNDTDFLNTYLKNTFLFLISHNTKKD